MATKILGVLLGFGRLFTLPLGFGISLLLLFLAYVLLLGWLSMFPIFSWHFKVMSNVWYLGLYIVSKTWKPGIVGILILIIGSFFN